MRTLARAVLVLGVLALGTAACKKEDPYAIHKKAGNVLFKEKKWAEAAAEYEQALAVRSSDKLWEKTAYAYMSANQMDKAEASLLKLLDSAPDDVAKGEVYKKIANMFIRTGPITKVEQYFLEAVRVNPKDEAALSWAGEVYSQLGGAREAAKPAVPDQLEKAIGYYDRAISVNPQAQFPYVNKRIALLKLQNFNKQEMESALATKDTLAKDKKHKDPVKLAELDADIAEHQKQVDAFQVRIDEVTAKLREVKGETADGGMPAPPPPPPPAPAPAPEQ
jgi:tetratricopeptide (TPR) repeat protein